MVDREKIRKQLPISIIRSITDRDLRQCEEYLQEMERFLKSEVIRANKFYQKEISQAASKEKKEFIGECLGEDLWTFEQLFPQNLRTSTLIFILAFFEYDLKLICQSAKKTFCISEELPSFRTSVSKSAKDFLKRAVGLEIPDGGGSNWNQISHFISIRNAITHSSSYIEEEDTARYIRQREGLDFDEHGRVLLQDIIMPDVISTMRAFFEDIISAWREKIK